MESHRELRAGGTTLASVLCQVPRDAPDKPPNPGISPRCGGNKGRGGGAGYRAMKASFLGLDILGRRESISLEIKRDPFFFFNPPVNLVKFLLISGSSAPLLLVASQPPSFLTPHSPQAPSFKASELERKSGHSGMQLITASALQFQVLTRVGATVWWPSEAGRAVSCGCCFK